MLLAEPIVRMAYGWDNCRGRELFWIPTDCTNRVFDTSLIFGNAIKVIIFLNGFIALVTVLMIIYAGILILTGWWDEEKSEKAKKIITYAIVWVVIIIFSYVLYRAMLFNVN
jgi:glucose uptake protein GlcU